MDTHRALILSLWGADARLPGCGDTDILHTCLAMATAAGAPGEGYALRDALMKALVQESEHTATMEGAEWMPYGLWEAPDGRTIAWWMSNAETRWMDLGDCSEDERTLFAQWGA